MTWSKLCDEYRCGKPATVDFGRYVKGTGRGYWRYLCERHARGLKKPSKPSTKGDGAQGGEVR